MVCIVGVMVVSTRCKFLQHYLEQLYIFDQLIAYYVYIMYIVEFKQVHRLYIELLSIFIIHIKIT